MTRLDVDVLQRIEIRPEPVPRDRFGRDALDQPADAGHLAMQELVLQARTRERVPRGIRVADRPAEPWRSIDVVLASRARRLMILNECWNTFSDIGAAARATMRKATELEALATGRWGPDVTVRVVWIDRATAHRIRR